MGEQKYQAGPISWWKALAMAIAVNTLMFVPLLAVYLSLSFILFGPDDLNVAIDDFLFGAPIGAVMGSIISYFLIQSARQRLSRWIVAFLIFVPLFTFVMLLLQNVLGLPNAMRYLPMQAEIMFGSRAFVGSLLITVAFSLPLAVLTGFLAWALSPVLIRLFASSSKA